MFNYKHELTFEELGKWLEEHPHDKSNIYEKPQKIFYHEPVKVNTYGLYTQEQMGENFFVKDDPENTPDKILARERLNRIREVKDLDEMYNMLM